MTCDDVCAWLRRDLDGAAEPSADAAEHLERCPACREEASRLKGVAATARAALPEASVPLGFAEHVMADVERPPADRALARAAGSRLRSWLPVAAALVLVPIFAWWWERPAVLVEGDLRMERDGLWQGTGVARRGETFGLAPGAVARAEGVTVTARTRAVLRADRPLRLIGGACVVTAGGEPARVETRLGRIELRAHTACEVSLQGGQEVTEVTFGNIVRAAPVALAITLLAGGATVVNAQGEAEAGHPGDSVRTDGGAPELEKINREIDRTQRRLDKALAEVAELKAELAGRARRRPVPGPTARNFEQERREVDMAALRAEYERTKKRLAEIERILGARNNDVSVHDLLAVADQQQELLAARVKALADEKAIETELHRFMNLAAVIHLRATAARLDKEGAHAALLENAQARIEEAAILLERAMRLRRKIDAGESNEGALDAELAAISEDIAAMSKNIQRNKKKRNPEGAR